jgi:hypothetical protein
VIFNRSCGDARAHERGLAFNRRSGAGRPGNVDLGELGEGGDDDKKCRAFPPFDWLFWRLL